MTDTTQEIKDIVAELNEIPATEDIPNSENWNKKAAQDDKKGDNAGETQTPPKKFKDNFEELAAIFDAAARPNFEAAKDAERKQGEGIDLGFYLYRRENDDSNLYFNTPEKILFAGINFVCARTGGGKTFFKCALASKILNDKPRTRHVVFISLEETKQSIEKHIITAVVNMRLNDQEKDFDIMEHELSAALLDKLTGEHADEKIKEIKETYREVSSRLVVIDKLSFEAAAEKVFKTGKTRSKNAAILKREYPLEFAATVKNIIRAAIKQCGGAENVVFFIDYAQMMKDPDGGKGSATYKELQAVANHLKDAASEGALMFVGAQMSREVIKGIPPKATGDARRAAEFFGAMPEQMREAADLEQSAEKIIYLTIQNRDGDNGLLNIRLLKNRRGIKDLYGSAEMYAGQRTVDFEKMSLPAWGDADGHAANFKGGHNDRDDDEML